MRLVLRSLAHHRGSAVATGLVALVGTALVTAMACLLATGLAGGTHAGDRPFLTGFPLILGGWVIAIVLFAMVSTVGVALIGRAGEITGLRLVGATPGQVRAVVAAETLVVSAVAAVPGLGGGYLLGWAVLERVRAAGLLHEASAYAPGALLPVLGAAVVLAASVAAGWFGARGLASRSPVGEDVVAGTRSATARRVAAGLVIVAGLGSASAVLGVAADDVLATAMTGPACVLLPVGLGMLAPELVALAARVLRLVPGRGAAAHLASITLSVAPDRVRPAVTFLTLFVGVAGGTLSMQGIENSRAAADATGRVLASVNYLVVGLITVFIAIALTNNLVAAIGRRRGEFGTLSLLGATTGQTRRMLLREVGAAIAVSVLAGVLGALVCVVPFAVVKTGDPLAALTPVPYLLSAGVAAVIALGVASVAGTRSIRSAATAAA